MRSLLLSGSIQTTETKAKAIKGIIDKIITQAKSPTTQRFISQFLTDKTITEKLIKDVAPRLSDRTSGYTSIIKMGKRLGDGAMVVKMSLLLNQNGSQKNFSSLMEEKKAAKSKIENVEEVTEEVEKEKVTKAKSPTKNTKTKS